jgi:hypothetical protein
LVPTYIEDLNIYFGEGLRNRKLATGDPRNIEAAQITYEKEIVKYVRTPK